MRQLWQLQSSTLRCLRRPLALYQRSKLSLSLSLSSSSLTSVKLTLLSLSLSLSLPPPLRERADATELRHAQRVREPGQSD